MTEKDICCDCERLKAALKETLEEFTKNVQMNTGVIEQLEAENKKLKAALGHTEAALANWGDNEVAEVKLECEWLKKLNLILRHAIYDIVNRTENDEQGNDILEITDKAITALEGDKK